MNVKIPLLQRVVFLLQHYRSNRDCLNSCCFYSSKMNETDGQFNEKVKIVLKSVDKTELKKSRYVMVDASEIEVPEKVVPIGIPEEPTTCCMSGCANCVWIEYAEQLINYFKDGGEKAEKEILQKVSDPNMKAFLMTELRCLKNKNA